MADAEITSLIKKRGNVKRHITNFATFFTEHKKGPIDSLKINLRLTKLKSVMETLDQIQDRLEELAESEEDLNRTAQERFDIQESYYDLVAEAENIMLKETNQSFSITTGPTETSNQNGDREREAVRKRRVKLPEASLPTFSGNYEDWLSFKDSFTSLIDEQDDLSNVEKLQYLKSALRGEAADKIKSMCITDENYKRAWDLLQDSYADERAIISRHLSLILRLPEQERETPEGLRKLANDTLQHVESLKALGVNISEEILVQNLEEKLHKNTADKWEETLKPGKFPTLKEMINFLYASASRLSKRKEGSNKNEASIRGSQNYAQGISQP